jgi:hypothetical protein
MSKSLIAGLPGGAPSNARERRSGEMRGRFAFLLLPRMILVGLEPPGRIFQIDGNGSSDQ